MPIAATVYSLLLASSALTTPAIEELTAIRQRELTEEEIAAQIEESRIERIDSQFDGRELPLELEAAAQAETPTPADAKIEGLTVYPTEMTPAMAERLAQTPPPDTAPAPSPASNVIVETTTPAAAPTCAPVFAGSAISVPPQAPAAAASIRENRHEIQSLTFDPSVTAVGAEPQPEAAPEKPQTAAGQKEAKPSPVTPSAPVPTQGFTVTPARSADYRLIAPLTLPPSLLPAHFGRELPGDKAVLEARQAAAKGDADRLRSLAREVKNHPLGGYVELWALNAQADRDLKKTKKLSPAVEKAYARFIEAHRTDYLVERARTDWIRNAAESSDAKRFAALYPKLEWNKGERDIVCARQTFALGKGKPSAAALAQAKKLLLNTTAPQIDFCRRLAERTLAADRGWTWQYMLILLQKKRYTLAAELVKDTPARYLPVNKRELTQVLANPSRWLQNNRQSLKKKSPRLLIAASLRIVQKDLGAAVRIAHATDGRINAATRALLWGRLGYEASVDQDAAALRYYKLAGSALKSAPSSTLIVNGSAVLNWRARAALRTGTPEQVLAAIAELPAELRSADNWKYWKARMLAEQGHKAQADKIMAGLTRGYEFYNLLAADSLGKPYYKGPESMTPPADPARFAAFSKNPSIERAVRFYALGLPNEGHREWNWALRGMKTRDRLEMAEYAGALGLEHRRINTAASTGRAAFNQLYPKPFAQEIGRAADTAQLSRNWIFGLIRQESRFISLALSKAGALGLMQVMPATARWVAKQTGMSGYRSNQISDIETNLFLGTQYLRLVRENVSPNVTLATASYNAGPSKAAAWRSTLTREVDGALFAETIPYSETRDYVMRVTTNTVQYSRYTDEPLRLTDLLGRIAPQPLSGNIIP